MQTPFSQLITRAKACTLCNEQLPFPPKPVFAIDQSSAILIIGQAPGLKVQQSGIPWDDASGRTLRQWLGVEPAQFYDSSLFGILPMGFCYPGKGKSGDLPPRPECAPAWHEPLLTQLHQPKLILLIGQYAQHYYLGKVKGKNLTQTVRQWRDYLPRYLPLPHPSPRNRFWLAKNPWFGQDVLPHLKHLVEEVLMTRN